MAYPGIMFTSCIIHTLLTMKPYGHTYRHAYVVAPWSQPYTETKALLEMITHQYFASVASPKRFMVEHKSLHG